MKTEKENSHYLDRVNYRVEGSKKELKLFHEMLTERLAQGLPEKMQEDPDLAEYCFAYTIAKALNENLGTNLNFISELKGVSDIIMNKK